MPKVLQPLQRVTAGDMSLTSITSGVVDGRYLQNLKWQIIWTGSPTGTFSLQESLDYNPATGNGTWIDGGQQLPQAIGVADSAIVNLADRAPCFYRLVYTKTAGSAAGTLNVYASGSGPS